MRPITCGLALLAWLAAMPAMAQEGRGSGSTELRAGFNVTLG